MIDEFDNPFIHPLFSRYIEKNKVQVIMELGVRDGLFTKVIKGRYEAEEVICVEANPFLIESIKASHSGFEGVRLFNTALFDKEGEIDFFLNEDGGSSSIYDHPFCPTQKITVPCDTMDSFCAKNNIQKIDLICADIEGAEAAAFRNSKIVKNCKYIITEVKFDDFFKGKDFPNLKNLEDSLHPMGFKMVERLVRPNYPFGDSLWIK